MSRLSTFITRALAALSLAIIPTSAVCADWITWDAGGGDDTAFTTDANWTGDVFPGTVNIAELRDGADGKTISFTSPGTQVGGVYVRNNWWNVTPSPVVFTASDNSYGFESLGGFGAGDIGNCLAAFTIEKGTYTAVDGYWGWGSGASLTATLNGGTLTYTGQYGLNIGWGNSGKVTATINVAGGTIATTGGSIKMGSVHTAESEVKMNVSNGGVVQCGSTTSEQWLSIGDNDGALGTISVNLNASGTLKAWHIANYSNGSGKDTLAFDGGTLEALGAGTDPLISSGVAVDVKSGGAIFNVGANALTIAAPVSGTGTITVKGTGSLTFTGDMSGFCGAVVVETSGCTVTLPASATKAVPGANTSASNGVYSYSANTTHHDWWTGDSSTDWATAGNWGRFLIDEGTTGYDINEWNDNTINIASVVDISKPLTITENDPNNSYNVEFTATSASDGLVSTDVLNVGTSNEGMATFTSGTYSFNNMYVGGSGATGSVTVNGASLTITTGDPLIGNGGTGTFTLSSGFVSFGYAGSAKWAFLKGGTINLDGGEMAVCRLNCDTAPAVINFNGGTLTSYNDGYNKDNIIENDANWTLNVKAGGAKFNIPSGLTTTVNQVLAGDAESTGGGLTKLGGGALVLLAEPTFTGVITVFGGSVKLPAGATVAAGENTVKYESADGVYFYPKYTWCGSANDGAWTNPANWLVGEVAAVGYPSAEGEVAVIATAATIYSDVAISVSEIQTDAAVTFAGKLTSSSLVKSGTGTLTLVGVTSPTTDFAITAGSVVINNSLDGITPYVQLDASNESTVTVTGDYVTKWTSSVAENDTTHYYENADSTMTLTTDYFGGKRAVRTNGSNLKADFSNKLGVRSVFAVLYGISYPDGMRLYYKTGANNVYIGKRNSGNNYWSCLIASKTTPASPYLWQNGALDSLWSTTAAGSVFTVKKFQNNSTSADYLGGTGDIAIGELIGLSAAEPSASDSKRIEAYLGNKWKISGMQTFATSIPLTLSAGTTLDLGGQSITIASIAANGTGMATVQNGKLTLTDKKITLTDGQVLVLPKETEYTLDDESINVNVDATTGVITLSKGAASVGDTFYPTVQAAINALLAEEDSGTLRVYKSEVVDLSSTAAIISDVVLVGDAQLTFTANLPWQASYSNGAIVNQRVASTFVWAPQNNSTDWATPGNWRIGNAVATALPGENDAVEFPLSNEEEFSGWSVTLATMQHVATVAVNANTTFTGAQIQVCNADTSTAAVTGTGTITFGNNAGFYTGGSKNDGKSLTIGTPIEITADAATPAIIRGFTTSSGSGGTTITFSGDISGDGYLITGGTRSTVYLNGDNSKFSGTLEQWNDAASAGALRSNIYIKDEKASSASAVWKINNSSANVDFVNEDGTYYFGALCDVPYELYKTCTFVVGGRADVDSIITGGNMRNETIRKVGSGYMSMQACPIKIADLHNGTFVIAGSITQVVVEDTQTGTVKTSTSTSSIPSTSISFSGDNAILAVSATLTKSHYTTNSVDGGAATLVSTDDPVFADPSAKIVGNSTYPICFSNAVNETHTWGTALAATNTKGLKKLGAGTLKLSQPPAYTGTTTVEAGALVIGGAFDTSSTAIAPGATLKVLTPSGTTPTVSGGGLYKVATATDGDYTVYTVVASAESIAVDGAPANIVVDVDDMASVGITADMTDDQKSDKLEATAANGLAVWQNYVMKIDGTATQKFAAVVTPTTDATMTVATSFGSVAGRTGAGVTVSYKLMKKSGETWVQVGDVSTMPSFAVDPSTLDSNARLKIQAVFK